MSGSPSPSPVLVRLLTSTKATSVEELRIGERLRIGVADLLTPGQTTTVTPMIDDDGKIGLLLIKPVVATELTADQLADNIAQAYSDAHLISNADVKVERIERPAVGVVPRFRLQAGDSIHVRIWDLEAMGVETKIERRLDGSGSVALPQLAKPLSMGGLLERDAATKIAGQYAADHVLMHASVEVVRANK